MYWLIISSFTPTPLTGSWESRRPDKHERLVLEVVTLHYPRNDSHQSYRVDQRNTSRMLIFGVQRVELFLRYPTLWDRPDPPLWSRMKIPKPGVS